MKQICPSLQIIFSRCEGTWLFSTDPGKNHIIIIIFCFSVKMTILTPIATHIANTIFVHVITILFCISFIPTRVVLVAVFLKHSTRDHVETTTFNVITRQQSTYLNTANADQFLEDPVTGPTSSANKQVHLRIYFFCLWFQRHPNLPLSSCSTNATAHCGN